jgi:hypothetical protein
VRPGIDHSLVKAWERRVCFVILNVQPLMFAARTQGKPFQGACESAEKGVLDHLLKNEVAMEILRTRGNTPESITRENPASLGSIWHGLIDHPN